MNTKHLFCTIIALMTLGSTICAQDTLRIGYIDFEQTLAEMDAYADVQTQLAQLAKNYDDEYARMETEYNNKVKEYIVNGKNLSEPIKLARQAEITEYEERLALYHKRYTDDLAKQRREREQPYVPPYGKPPTHNTSPLYSTAAHHSTPPPHAST